MMQKQPNEQAYQWVRSSGLLEIDAMRNAHALAAPPQWLYNVDMRDLFPFPI